LADEIRFRTNFYYCLNLIIFVSCREANSGATNACVINYSAYRSLLVWLSYFLIIQYSSSVAIVTAIFLHPTATGGSMVVQFIITYKMFTRSFVETTVYLLFCCC